MQVLHIVRAMRASIRLSICFFAPLVGAIACDLPPGFNEANPSPRVRAVDTADVNAPPLGDNIFTADFVGWQFGGNFGCTIGGPVAPGTPGTGVGAPGGGSIPGGGTGTSTGTGTPTGNPGTAPGTSPGTTPGTPGQPIPANQNGTFPTVVEIWEGVPDPCNIDRLPEGARVLRIELSDIASGTYNVVRQCVGGRSAGAVFGQVRGGQLFLAQATSGSIAILGLNADDVLQGTFSLAFPGLSGITSGGFAATARCF